MHSYAPLQLAQQTNSGPAPGRRSGTRRVLRCEIEPNHLEPGPVGRTGSQERPEGRLRDGGPGSLPWSEWWPRLCTMAQLDPPGLPPFASGRDDPKSS
jgi:hypothetical protein